MTLTIRNADTDRLARQEAQRTGMSIIAVVKAALKDYAAAFEAAQLARTRGDGAANTQGAEDVSPK
jgi:hypothetical protein